MTWILHTDLEAMFLELPTPTILDEETELGRLGKML